MKKLLALTFVVILSVSFAVPAFAGGPEFQCPKPPCPKPYGDMYGSIDVAYNGPEGVTQDTTAAGELVFTVTSDQWATVPNVPGPGTVASGFDLWVVANSGGNTSFAYDDYNAFVASGGKIEYGLSGEIQLTIPVTVEPDSIVSGYADSIQYLYAANKCGSMSLWQFISVYREWYIAKWLHMDLKPVTTDVKGIPPANTRWADIWTGDLGPDGEIYRWWKNPNWHHNADDLFVWSIYPNGEKPRTMLYRFCAADGTPLAPGPDLVYVVDVPRMSDPAISFELATADIRVMSWDDIESEYGVRP